MRIRLLFILLLSVLRISAQGELQITDFYIDAQDATAKTQSDKHRDALGRPCAKLKVQIVGECKFEGNYVMETIKDVGEYHVYMSKGAKTFTIKAEDCAPLDVRFSACGDKNIITLEPEITYVLKLAIPSDAKREKLQLGLKVLKNGIDDRNESLDFKNEDDLYVKFVAPINGYLAIYLQNGNSMECLLPYKNSKAQSFPVKAFKEYILFYDDSHKKDEERITLSYPDKDVIDEYTLGTDQPNGEVNELYFVFSPNEFRKSKDKEQSGSRDLKDIKKAVDYPRSIDKATFVSWMNDRLASDKRLQVVHVPITIMPK